MNMNLHVCKRNAMFRCVYVCNNKYQHIYLIQNNVHKKFKKSYEYLYKNVCLQVYISLLRSCKERCSFVEHKHSSYACKCVEFI